MAPDRNAEDERHPGKVHRYRVTHAWGDAPITIYGLIGADDAYCIDYWRGEETVWEVAKHGEIIGGWAGEYAGINLEAAARYDGEVSDGSQ